MEDRAKWLEERRKGIGGSDAPVVCGLSKRKSPYELWLEKRGEAPEAEDTEPMFWGRTLEPVIRQRYANETGKVVEVPGKILVHPKHPWMIANVDGIIPGERVLEVKTARTAEGWGEEGTDEVPQAYLIQVQHYLAVTGLPVADVAVLIGGQDYRTYEVPADDEAQEMIIEREVVFWERVKHGPAPEPTTFKALQAKFGSASREARVQADAECLEAYTALLEIKALKAQEERLKTVIMKKLGAADTLVEGDRVLVTWKAGKPSRRFDAKAFQADHPDLYEQYRKEGAPSRRFLVKKGA